MKAEFLLEREKNTELTIYTVPNQEFRIHFHSHIEVCLVLKGEMQVWINNQEKLLRKGEISVAWSYDTHKYHTPSDSEVLSLIIPPKYFKEFSQKLSKMHTNCPFISNANIFSKIYEWIKEIEKSDDELMNKGYIYLILATLMNNMRFEETSVQVDRSLTSKILIYLSDHYKENITLPIVARELGYHPNYLSQIFKRTLKISFVEYINILRLREFLFLTKESNKSTLECALECGFQSLRTFYRAFQSEFGCSPRELSSLQNL